MRKIYSPTRSFYDSETGKVSAVSMSDFQWEVLGVLAECSGLTPSEYIIFAIKNNNFNNKSQGIRDVIIAQLVDLVLEKKERKMKNFLYRFYLRIRKPEAYGALLECDRLQKELQKAKRWHYRYAHLQTRLYEMRAIFERLRK